MLFDTQACEAFVLRTNFASSIVCPVTFLGWASDSEVIAVAEDPQSGRPVLTLYSAADRSLLLELHPGSFYRHACALSPSREDFAYWEGKAEGGGVFRILNVRTRRVTVTITPTGGKGYLSCPGWSEDSATFLYQDGALMAFHLPTATLKVLKEKPNRQLWRPISYTGQRVLCLINPHDGFPKKPSPIYVLDVPSGRESVISDREIWGEITAADLGTVIIYGMGQ